MGKVILILVLSLGGLLRFWRLGEMSLWKDELFSMLEAQKPLFQIFTSKTWFFGYNPVHYFFTHLALYFGKSEAIVRAPAVIFGLLTIFIIYKLGKEIFNQKVGLLSAFLLSISPLHLEYSREVRYYSFLIFFSSLTILFVYKMISEKKKNIWVILFALASLLNIATQPNALAVLMAEMMFLLAWLWWKKKFLGVAKKIGRRKAKETLVITGTILILIFLGSVFVKSFGELFAMAKFAPVMPPFAFLSSVLTSLGAGKGALFLYLGFFLWGFWLSFREKKKEIVLLLLVLVLPPLLVYFVRPKGFGFHIRYVSFIVVPYLLFVSYGVVRLLKRNTAILVAVFILALLSIQPIRAYYATKKGDWRGVGQYLIQNAEPGDVVITESYYNKILLDYYLEAQRRGIILKTAAESLSGKIKKFPFRRFFHQHDYVTRPERLSNLEEVPLIDYEGIVSFDPDAKISPMYLFVSRPVWVWQEAEDGPIANDGWGISIHYGRSTRGNDYLENPEAKISYKITIPKNGNYDLYANLRWDEIRGLLKYKIDNRAWSEGFRPFDTHGFCWKEKKLGTHYLTEGEHLVSFLNTSSGGKGERYQTIDYFYLTLNE